MNDLHYFSNKRICVAVSGGVDSVSLLHYLKSQAKSYGYFLSAVHCEHGIRGEESRADMRFVESLCKAWDVSLVVFSEDCLARAKREKQSLETVARDFRRECFAKLVEDGKTDFIALAHHADDCAETALFRLARGTSSSGVRGMSVLNGFLFRPFLTWTRTEIVNYARENQLSWREDKTNFDLDATRNKLRIEILPKLEEAVPGAAKNLVRFASLAGEDDLLLYEYAERLLCASDGEVKVEFCAKKPLFRRACLLALKALGLEKDYTALHLENAYLLQGLTLGAKCTFPQEIEAQKMENGLRFYKKSEPIFEEEALEKPFTQDGFDGGRYAVSISKTPIDASDNVLKTLRLDGERIPKTAVFRFRKEGDFIRRFKGGKKSLKKFFNEEKIPVPERAYLPLIAEDEGSEVYVVCGVEISERVKITEESKEILYLKLQKK